VEAMVSFQEGLWELLLRRPRTLRAAVRGRSHTSSDGSRSTRIALVSFTRRGHLDWDSPAGAELVELNRNLAGAYKDWMAPLVEAGEIRQMSMLMVTAVVNGPAHAIARRWLAGPPSAPLHSYLDDLADAACAALSGTPSARDAGPRRFHVVAACGWSCSPTTVGSSPPARPPPT